MSPEMSRTENDITPEALAHLGDGRIAYVRDPPEDVKRSSRRWWWPVAGRSCCAVRRRRIADYNTDSREAAVANAWSQELETVSVH